MLFRVAPKHRDVIILTLDTLDNKVVNQSKAILHHDTIEDPYAFGVGQDNIMMTSYRARVMVVYTKYTAKDKKKDVHANTALNQILALKISYDTEAFKADSNISLRQMPTRV